MVDWYNIEGQKILDIVQEVVYYPSKNEIRLLKIPRDEEITNFLKVGNLLLFRKEGGHLKITQLDNSMIHVINELGHRDLFDKLPR